MKKQVFCYHEVIRTLTAKAKAEKTLDTAATNPLLFVDDPLKFNTLLLNARAAHFFDAQQTKKEPCFFDRGVGDVLAYMDFFEQSYPPSFEETCQECNYDFVFILPAWKEIYTQDNERLETFEEAEKLHKHLYETYKRFGYNPIEIPIGLPEERMRFVLHHLNLSS